MPIDPLKPAQLRRICTKDHFSFETTADIVSKGAIIGQPRGARAIEFGIGIRSHGYNIFVLGETGTGRTTAIKKFLEEKTAEQPTPAGWLYVHNFSVPHCPRVIKFAPGEGVAFKRQMEDLLYYLRQDLPKAFDTDQYREEVEKLREEVNEERDQIMQAVQHEAAANGFTLLRTASGLSLAPVADGQVMSPELIQQMSEEERQKLEKTGANLGEKLEKAFVSLRQIEITLTEKLYELNQKVAKVALAHHFDKLRRQYQQYDDVQLYLDEMQQDVLEHLADFVPAEEQKEAPDLRRYEVNVFVDNSETSGAPVIVEPNPTYANLIGRIEYELKFGAMVTHFSNIKAGSLHRANGGYLVLNARDLLRNQYAWEALKRAIKQEEIVIQSPTAINAGNQALAKSLDPEPIPLDVKVILMGSPRLYYMMYHMDVEFSELFKVKADFGSTMPRDREHEDEYARFIATRCHEESLLHFDRSAVAKVIELGSRLCSHQDKLSARFGIIADVVREASFWAKQKEKEVVTGEEVRKAIDERQYRANEAEENNLELMEEGAVMVSTEGHVVGQVNGLSVLDLGDYSFGQPSRITAQTYMGEAGVIQIEREVNMAGPIHNKGLLTLIGYLGGKYAQEQPLSLSASVAFEQNYGGVDGDSAASTELYALLSSLSGKAIDQGIAVTGSVNQNGEIQPIGGASEKIEGFFKVCHSRGLTGKQGALIPIGNVKHLMLNEEVINAVDAGKFHVWAVSAIDEGIELLTGVQAGVRDDAGNYAVDTIHALVQERLRQLAEELKRFGEKSNEEE